MWTIRLRFTRCSFFLHCPASRNVLVANQSWNSNKIQSLKELCTTKASNCIRKLSIELLLVNCLSFVIPKPVDKRTCRREFHTIGYFDTLFFSIVLVRDRCLRLHCTSCSKQNNWSLQQENNESNERNIFKMWLFLQFYFLFTSVKYTFWIKYTTNNFAFSKDQCLGLI